MGMAFWVGISIGMARKEPDRKKMANMILAVVIIGIICSVIGAFFPRILIFVGHIIIYPILVLFGLFLLVSLISMPFLNKQKKTP